MLQFPGVSVITDSDPLPHTSLITCIYGDPGAGKTSLAFTAAAPIHCDFDLGLHRAIGRKTSIQFKDEYNGKRLVKTAYEKFREFLEGDALANYVQSGDVRSIVIDTGGTLLDDVMTPHLTARNSSLRNSSGGLTLQGYGALKQLFAQMVGRIKQMGLDCIFVCHVADKDEQARPKMTGGSLDILKEKADLMGYLHFRGEQRVLDFSPSETHYGKNVAEFDEITVPHYTDSKFTTLLDSLLEEAKQKISSMSEAQQAAIQFNQQLQERAAEADTPQDVVDLLNEAKQHGQTSFAAARPVLEQRYADLFCLEGQVDTFSEALHFNEFVQDLGNVPAYFKQPLFRSILQAAETAGVGYNKKQKKFFDKKDDASE